MASRGQFYVRVEDPEWKFLEKLDEPPFHAAIIKASHIAPYPEGDGRLGHKCDRSVSALRAKKWPWALDPATAPLGHPQADERISARARECPIASSTLLPWDTARLSTREGALEVVEAAEFLQRSSPALAAPYLEVGSVGDPRVEANCRMIEAAAELAGSRRPVAYLQVLRSHLRDGSAAEAAKRYVEAGAKTVMIRVRLLDPQDLKDLLPYLELIELIDSLGARPVADCVGRLGPVLVAGGADAFTAGARHFQKVPDRLSNPKSDEGGGSDKMPYLVPGMLAMVSPDSAGSHLPSCELEDCPAEDGLAKATRRRLHNLHEFKRLAGEAAAAGYAYVEKLQALQSAEGRVWAAALKLRATQRRAA